jgi:hypothetical protein
LKGDKGWRPLTTLSVALDWAWHGHEAFWPRLENIAFHAGFCVLIYMILRRRVRGVWMPGAGDTVFLDKPLIAAGTLRRVANAGFILQL